MSDNRVKTDDKYFKEKFKLEARKIAAAASGIFKLARDRGITDKSNIMNRLFNELSKTTSSYIDYRHGAIDENILVRYVPGSFELPLGAQYFAELENVDAVILLGCVIQGETRHFDYICDGVTQGIMDLNLKYNKPFIFGVLTTENEQQALDRAGGKHGNKGDEAAVTAIKMIQLKNSF